MAHITNYHNCQGNFTTQVVHQSKLLTIKKKGRVLLAPRGSVNICIFPMWNLPFARIGEAPIVLLGTRN